MVDGGWWMVDEGSMGSWHTEARRLDIRIHAIAICIASSRHSPSSIIDPPPLTVRPLLQSARLSVFDIILSSSHVMFNLVVCGDELEGASMGGDHGNGLGGGVLL